MHELPPSENVRGGSHGLLKMHAGLEGRGGDGSNPGVMKLRTEVMKLRTEVMKLQTGVMKILDYSFK